MIVISGGQTGVDRAALDAARVFDIKTGGHMPPGFLALDGFHPEFAKRYGMQEHTRPGYPPRTERNVKDADTTLQIARTFTSPGERLTTRLVKKHKKRHIVIDAANPLSVDEVVKSLYGCDVLNVAGNSEDTTPGIYDFAFEYLCRVFSVHTNMCRKCKGQLSVLGYCHACEPWKYAILHCR